MQLNPYANKTEINIFPRDYLLQCELLVLDKFETTLLATTEKQRSLLVKVC
jgi:hypothetical protein